MPLIELGQTVLILCSWMLAVYVSGLLAEQQLDDYQAYQLFKVKHIRGSGNSRIQETDDATRFEMFKRTYHTINRQNELYQRNEATFSLALNERADWTDEEHSLVNNIKVTPAALQQDRLVEHRIRGPPPPSVWARQPPVLKATKKKKAATTKAPPHTSRRPRTTTRTPAKRTTSRGTQLLKRATTTPKKTTTSRATTWRPTPSPPPPVTVYGYPPVNWATKSPNPVVPPLQQSSCGSCWIFSSLDVLAAQIAIKHKTTAVSISKQWCIDCVVPWGCGGGWPATIWNLIEKRGMVTDAQYPIRYVAKNSGKCRANSTVAENPFTNTGRGAVDVLAGSTEDEVAIIDALYNIGPLVVLVNANCPAFSFYKSGIIYKSGCDTSIDHAVTAVGFGADYVNVTVDGRKQLKLIPYYLIKNSWGMKWGSKGYVKVAVGMNEIGIAHWGGRYPSLDGS